LRLLFFFALSLGGTFRFPPLCPNKPGPSACHALIRLLSTNPFRLPSRSLLLLQVREPRFRRRVTSGSVEEAREPGTRRHRNSLGFLRLLCFLVFPGGKFLLGPGVLLGRPTVPLFSLLYTSTWHPGYFRFPPLSPFVVLDLTFLQLTWVTGLSPPLSFFPLSSVVVAKSYLRVPPPPCCPFFHLLEHTRFSPSPRGNAIVFLVTSPRLPTVCLYRVPAASS